MSDAERPDHATPPEAAVTDVDGNPIPSPEVLAEQSLPAIYTRSPRLVRVVVTGGAVGALVGAIVGAVLPSGFVSGRFATAMIMGLAGALAGALVTGVLVAVNDNREAKYVAARKAEEVGDWIAAHPDAIPAGDDAEQEAPASDTDKGQQA